MTMSDTEFGWDEHYEHGGECPVCGEMKKYIIEYEDEIMCEDCAQERFDSGDEQEHAEADEAERRRKLGGAAADAVRKLGDLYPRKSAMVSPATMARDLRLRAESQAAAEQLFGPGGYACLGDALRAEQSGE
jgi:transcription initiation factor TFIIIB Brf1 subunit/transcription initiation factor TFIIB